MSSEIRNFHAQTDNSAESTQHNQHADAILREKEYYSSLRNQHMLLAKWIKKHWQFGKDETQGNNLQ